MSKIIEPVKKISGEIKLPGDKSISHRALMLGAIASGDTRVKGLLDCDDCDHTMRAFKEMGVSISRNADLTVISGKGLRGLTKPKGPVNVGESGTSMRLLAGILAGHDFETKLEGGPSLSVRPMKRIIEPLTRMGVDVKSASGGLPPLKIRGGAVKPIDYKMPVPSAQVKSAILLAALYAEGVTTVEEVFRSRDHTERMLGYFGAAVDLKGLKVSIKGPGALSGKLVEVPGDISSASFFMTAAALIPGSKVRMSGVGVNPTRAGILEVLSRMGANARVLNRRGVFEPVGDIEVESAPTKGIIIEEAIIPSLIDELPVIFVLAALSKGRTVIQGAKELKVKETDRVRSMTENLVRMGAKIKLDEGAILIDGVSALNGAGIKTFGDHRTCMAMAIAALAAKCPSTMDDAACVNKSFPGFFETLERLR